MSDKIKVTKKELAQFIMDQPDNRKVDMSGTTFNSECGCLMVQYGKHRGFGFNTVGVISWMNDGYNATAFITDGEYADFGEYNIETYADLKEKAKKVLES